MRRTPIVLGATVVGLVGVLVFHTRPSSVSIGAIPAAGSTAAASPGGTTPSPSSAASGAPPRPGPSSSPSQRATTRTATGPSVNYSWGVLSVKVTVSGTRITKVGIAALDDYGNPRSESIDQQSIPMLEEQALQAQSANIQGVSGASYTSAGFAHSLQGALQQLGLA